MAAPPAERLPRTGAAASSRVSCRKISSRLMADARSSCNSHPASTTARARSLRIERSLLLSTSAQRWFCRGSRKATRLTPVTRASCRSTAAASSAPFALPTSSSTDSPPRARCCRFSTESVATSLPAVDDHHLLAGLLDFGQDVRAENDGVVAGQAADQRTRLVDLLGVQAGRRLVQNQHVGIVDDGLRQSDALPVALGELAGGSLAHVLDVAALEHIFDALAQGRAGKPLQPADESEVFDDSHLRIQWRRFRQGSRCAA